MHISATSEFYNMLGVIILSGRTGSENKWCHITMDQQRYEPFDIDKGADNLFFIGSAFMVLLWFLL